MKLLILTAETETKQLNLVELLRESILKLFNNVIGLNSQLSQLLSVILMVIFWLLIGFIIGWISKLIIRKSQRFSDKQTKQGMTVSRLITSLIRALFFFWIAVMILKEIGIDVLPVLAGAGVLAFAVGFGAQTLIKDLLGGFFLIMEKTFSIGDHVTIGSHSGIVDEIGLRRTKIKTWKGEIITINNGDIKTVINNSQEDSMLIIEFMVEFATDIAIFETESFNNFMQDFYDRNNVELLEVPYFNGIQSLKEGNIKLRILAKTQTRKQNTIQRDLRRELVDYCHNNDIELEIPLVVEVKQ